MARERWFYELDEEKRGPMSLDQLVSALKTLPEPRTCLVWKNGMPIWLTAAQVPEIEKLLPPVAPLAGPLAGIVPGVGSSFPAATSFPSSVDSSSGTTARSLGAARAPVEARPLAPRPAPPARGGNPMLLVGGGGAAVALIGIAVWALFLRPSPQPPTAVPTRGPSTGPIQPPPGGATSPGPRGGASPAVTSIPRGTETAKPSPEAGGDTTKGGQSFAGWSDTEQPLPKSELDKLRGVAGWSGNSLNITLYNGSTWRVTELLVRTSRLDGEKFVDSAQPSQLMPVTEQLNTGVEDLLKRVVPDRRKPGVNPLDTGAFEAKVGPQPEAYRWKIEGAKGYPPRTEG